MWTHSRKTISKWKLQMHVSPGLWVSLQRFDLVLWWWDNGEGIRIEDVGSGQSIWPSQMSSRWCNNFTLIAWPHPGAWITCPPSVTTLIYLNLWYGFRFSNKMNIWKFVCKIKSRWAFSNRHEIFKEFKQASARFTKRQLLKVYF